MSFSPSASVAFAIAVALIASTPGSVRAATDIGRATAITTSVTSTMDSQSIVLKTGDEVFANQTVSTDSAGVGQFEFRDQTKLAIGPGSTIVLDNFVYNPKASGSRIVINLARGSFRFVTGKADHDAYEITTPTATIGVRGTAFDVYVGDTGELAIAMLNGAVDVCPQRGQCYLHNVVGRFLHMTVDGAFSLHDKWDSTLFNGVALKSALPFIADQHLLVPALRGETKIVASYVAGTATAVDKTVKTLVSPKLKLPRLKLPPFFK